MSPRFSPDVSLMFNVMAKDNNRTIPFLVDTGSARSIIPCDDKNNNRAAISYLSGVGGHMIPVYDRQYTTITINNKNYSHKFDIASVSNAIFGSDFLSL